MRHSFLIRRKNVEMYISQLDPIRNLDDVDEDERTTWIVSSSMTQTEKDSAAVSSYASIDEAIRSYTSSKYYYLRLGLGAFTFLVTYFFMSLVVRDPIPMIDELLISTVLTVVVLQLAGSRIRKSPFIQRKNLAMRNASGSFDEETKGFMTQIESFLYDLDSRSQMDVCDMICHVDMELPELDIDDPLLPELFRKILLFNPRMKKWYRMVKDITERDELAASKLLKHTMRSRMDISLLALLVRMKKFDV